MEEETASGFATSNPKDVPAVSDVEPSNSGTYSFYLGMYSLELRGRLIWFENEILCSTDEPEHAEIPSSSMFKDSSPLQCEECPYVAMDISEWTAHSSRHGQDNIRTYMCSACVYSEDDIEFVEFLIFYVIRSIKNHKIFVFVF